jgi:crotonobetainyl-CoA:carnitine CoA-transferase CaiB-like acyl-CoA transferase
MLPLEGLKILAVSQYGAGPFCTMHLADLGAEVIKIEDPSTDGDISRYISPFTIEKDSLFFQTFNRNKKSITINMRTPEGKQTFHDLVKVSDVVFSNLRGDLPAKLGLDYESLKGINPAIVCASLSGFGATGPRMKEPGYDYLIQGLAGWMDLTGEPDGTPTKSGLSLVDFSTGFVAALGIMVGVYKAQKTGVGSNIDVSLFDTAVSLLTYLAVWHLNKGFQPQRMADSAHPTIVPSQSFQTSDGHMVVMCQKQKFWENLCDALGRQDLVQEEKFGSQSARYENKHLLLPILKEIFMQKTTRQWLELLQKCDVPCGPVNTFEQVFEEPQLLAREMLLEVEHPVFGKVRQMACPIKIDGTARRKECAPSLGSDTESVLKECLKYDDRKIAELKTRGAI